MNSGLKPVWAGQTMRLDPFRLPQAASYATRDDIGEVVFSIDRRGVTVQRVLTMSGLPATVTCIRMADPVDAIAGASAGTAFVVLSHSHALDYRLAEAALARGDAAYVGMIGSATKRARFESGFLRSGGRRETLARLTCPIGGSDVDDKRPEVIAALTAAELVRCLLGRREPAKGRRSRHESAA